MVGRTGWILRTIVLAALSLAALGGCDERAISFSTHHADKGLVIVLPGIDGVALHNMGVADALAAGDVPAAVELWNWTSPLGPLFNQTAMEHNRQVAGQLARRIERYRSEHSDGAVFLIGHSGGTAIAAWAVEALDPSAGDVDGIVMLGSSLSPTYDLSAALSRCRRGIVNFYSAGDAGLLGAGTAMFGTMDRQSADGAGRIGFAMHRTTLVQVPWEAGMSKLGYNGDHFSCCAKKFIAAYVVPLLSSETWDQTVLASAP